MPSVIKVYWGANYPLSGHIKFLPILPSRLSVFSFCSPSLFPVSLSPYAHVHLKKDIWTLEI